MHAPAQHRKPANTCARSGFRATREGMAAREIVSVVRGDITQLDVEAIVNAANERMLGGGGVDGAIHRAAGEQLVEACRAVEEVTPGVRCPTGQARLTPGFHLRAKYVIHTVGPIWRGGRAREPELLASCYRSCLHLAQEQGARSIAFPAISCGVYGYPRHLAAAIAVRETTQYVRAEPFFERILLTAFDAELHTLLIDALLTAQGPL